MTPISHFSLVKSDIQCFTFGSFISRRPLAKRFCEENKKGKSVGTYIILLKWCAITAYLKPKRAGQFFSPYKILKGYNHHVTQRVDLNTSRQLVKIESKKHLYSAQRTSSIRTIVYVPDSYGMT